MFSRILVVDDSLDNLFLLQTVLEAEGYEVETADSGTLALNKASSDPPDLILLDLMMPGIGGYEVTQRIRQNAHLPFIPILIITAHEAACEAETWQVGANGMLRKPIDLDELLRNIRVLEKQVLDAANRRKLCEPRESRSRFSSNIAAQQESARRL